VWLEWLELPMTKVRSGPNWASIELAHEALVGVRHSSTLFFLAQARIVEGGVQRGVSKTPVPLVSAWGTAR
jgi:hypothetical protein